MNPPPQPPAATRFPSHHPNQPPPHHLPSLPTVLSDLSSLLHLSTAALRSLPFPTTTTSSALLPCPGNPNHRLPPPLLFSHYLNCPTPISLSQNFQYPHSLHSAATTSITPPAHAAASSDDLSISLESYMGFKAPANSFFYQNCPGPVTPSEPPRLLIIPRDLYIECADFDNHTSLKNVMSYSVNFIRFLPSEIWAIRSEIEDWGSGFPAAYSCRILRAILRLRDCKLLHLSEWIVSNSPRYGVVVDFAISDHMVLLIILCLKVVVKDAFVLSGIMSKDGELKMENFLPALSSQSFECPVLVKVMMWLSLQFSILYGDVNGKLFTVEVLKECILDAALHASLFRSEGDGAEQSGFKKVNDIQESVQGIEFTDDSKRDEGKNINRETVGNRLIFISQVVAAVTGLHERTLIEEKIKALRNSRPLPAYQRNIEHEYVSKLANEERGKRPDYRPVIEHDGFFWQRSNNQETNKVKTTEELLAEERDYKRRRMSYRGKKVKRNPLEVMRDIIKEYTDEIKQAGGIDDMSKAREETEALASDDSSAQGNATGVSGSRRNSEIPEANRDKLFDYRSELSSHNYSEGLEDNIMQPRQDMSCDHEHKDFNSKVERNRYDGNYLGSRDGRKSSSSSREHIRGRERQGYVQAREGSPQRSMRRSRSRERNHHRYRNEHEQNDYKREREDRDRSSRKRESSEDNRKHGERGRRDGARQGRHEDSGGHGDRKRGETKRSSRSHPELQEFDDRYDPAESHGLYNDDF